MRIGIMAALLAGLACAGAGAQQAPKAEAAAPGATAEAGQRLVATACTECHSLQRIQIRRLPRASWEDVVNQMLDQGADLAPEDVDTVVDYLTRKYGKVNLNQASPEELAQVLAISSAQAQALVAYREKNGLFKQLEDVAKVPGLDAPTVAGWKDKVVF